MVTFRHHLIPCGSFSHYHLPPPQSPLGLPWLDICLNTPKVWVFTLQGMRDRLQVGKRQQERRKACLRPNPEKGGVPLPPPQILRNTKGMWEFQDIPYLPEVVSPSACSLRRDADFKTCCNSLSSSTQCSPDAPKNPLINSQFVFTISKACADCMDYLWPTFPTIFSK